jgi:uncharacterized protein (DUF488 family)
MVNELYFTIGHSTRSVADVIELLQEAGANLVADVRSVPRSATNPQFNNDRLPTTLAAHGLDYRHLALLGGLRHRQKSLASSPNSFWQNTSFRNYADYALSSAFRTGLLELRGLAADHHPAIMCAESVWWRCHRRIITDYLLAAGADVRHILGPGKIEPAHMTDAATPQPDGTLIYT